MKNTKRIASIALSTVMLASSVVSFAADGDVFNKSDSSLFGNSSQILRDKAKRRAVLTGEDKYLYEINGALYTLVDVNKAYTVNKADFMGEIINNPDIYKPVGEASGELKVVSVSAINKTTVKVVLSQEVDSAVASNFTIEGGNITSASLADDKKTVTLSVSNLAYDTEYTVVTKDIPVNGELKDFGSKSFKSPAVTDLWELQIVTSSPSLIADGADNLEVTFNLLSKETGVIDKNADDIVLDLNTTYGRLASKRATVQDGTATVLLTSEFSNTNINAKIDAQIIEASGDYKDLIGKVFATLNVPFVTSATENVDTLTLVSAEANQADRITLFFDKEVSLKHLVDTNAQGELLYNIAGGPSNVTARNIPANTNPADISHVFKVAGKTVEIAQGSNTNFIVQGFKPVSGNSKAVEVVLDKTTVLKDNANVKVDVVAVNSLDKETVSSAEFKVTDARKPEATSVNVEGLNTLKVKFSEAIEDATFKLDGRFVGERETATNTKAAALANGATFTYTFGEFNPSTLVDNRDLATIELLKGNGGTNGSANVGYDEDGIVDSLSTNKTLSGYFSTGNHTLQISSTKDFAYVTDTANMGTTQNLGFKIAADTAQPTAIVEVESPEQFRLKFDKAVSATGSQVQNMIDTAQTIKLQVKDSNGTYVDATGLTAGQGKVDHANDLIVTKVSDTEFMIELKTDWTTIHDTDSTNKNYYNFEYRLSVEQGIFTNVANGLKNEKMEISLNTQGSPLNTPDTTSPVISNVVRIGDTNALEVTMNEPVKLVLTTPNTQDNAGNTLAQGQGVLAQTTVQFIGKDKDGKVVTINGNVTSYTSDDNGRDSKFGINWTTGGTTVTPQSVVDAGGSTKWDVVVRAISDDVGNTAASATFPITLEKSAATNSPFFVDYNLGAGGVKNYKVVGAGNGAANDTIEVTFSEGVQFSGLSDATNPANYTLNGETLPVGTSISIADDSTATHATAEGFEKVIISLPDGTLNAGSAVSNVITVNKNLVSYDDSKIQGDTEIAFTVSTGVTGSSASTAIGAAHNTGGTTAQQGVYTVAFTGTGNSALNDTVVIDGETLTILTGGDKDVTASEVATLAGNNANLAAKYTFDGTTTAGTLEITQKSGEESATAPVVSATIADSSNLSAGAVGTTTAGVVYTPHTSGGTKQEETLTVATAADAAGNIVVEFTDGTTIVSKTITVAAGETKAMIANKIATAFGSSVTLNSKVWNVAASGDTVTFTADVEAANNASVEATIK